MEEIIKDAATGSGIALSQLGLVVRDMTASVAFYSRLGLSIEVAADGQHASASAANGMTVEWDTTPFRTLWDTGWAGTTGGSTVIGFAVPTPEAVDQAFADLIAAGGRSHQPPYDAFWGARYAIVEDPDRNPVGLMSPIQEDRKFWPPTTPPSAV